MTMRVYEFSKKYGLTNKQVLDTLHKGGFEAKSHMVVLSQAAMTYLQNEFVPESSKPSRPTKSDENLFKPGAATTDIRQPDQKKPSSHPIQSPISAAVKKPVVSRGRLAKRPVMQRSPDHRKAEKQPIIEIPKEIVVAPMSVAEAATKLGQSVNDVIITLLRWGILAPKNQLLKEEVVRRLAEHFNVPIVSAQPATVIRDKVVSMPAEESEHLQERLPIVVVLGHVDHGKTTLLDFIRKTRVAAREKGGITQHLGAYEATTPHGNVVFLDTPGHEAFTLMRQRGIRVADIAILVVAADDGVMPQTIEAIKQAQALKVPLVVAINKVDKVEPTRLDVIKQELAQHDVIPEEWGGQAVCVPVSAKNGTGIDKLLEMVLLQTQLMELRADMTGHGKGFVLESKLQKGYGAVATIILQHGIVKVGDFFKCSNTVGKVTALLNSQARLVKEVGPSVPVLIAGFEQLPEAGDFFEVVSKDDYKTAKIAHSKEKSSIARQLLTEHAINMIIKTDSNSSKEALLESVAKLSKRLDRGFNVISSGIGNITEGDIELAYTTNSLIFGLHVKIEANAQQLAQQRQVSFNLFDIIYKLLEDLEKRAEVPKRIELVRTKIGQATVLKVFDIKNIGVVAGCVVTEGRFSRDGSVVVWRSNRKIGEGKITSLQREKKTVKEVHNGFEFGVMAEKFNDFQVDDRIECHVDMPKK